MVELDHKKALGITGAQRDRLAVMFARAEADIDYLQQELAVALKRVADLEKQLIGFTDHKEK